MAASDEALQDLHTQLAVTLSNEITKAENSEEGSKGLASMLNVARQFLKDNNIQSTATPGNPLGKLQGDVSKFPFTPSATDVDPRSH